MVPTSAVAGGVFRAAVACCTDVWVRRCCLCRPICLLCPSFPSYDYGNLPAPYPALNATEIAAFCEGEALVVTAAQEWLIANGGYEYDCFEFVTSE